MTDHEPIDSPNEDGTTDSPQPNAAEDALQAAQEAVHQVRSVAEDESAVSPTPEEQVMLDAATSAMADAHIAAQSASTTTDGAKPLDLPQLLPEVEPRVPEEIALLSDVNLNVKIELGRTRMLVEDVLRLGSGAVVELDKLAGDPVDVFVNERLVARGEVLVLNDSFCVRISEIVSVETKEPSN